MKGVRKRSQSFLSTRLSGSRRLNSVFPWPSFSVQWCVGEDFIASSWFYCRGIDFLFATAELASASCSCVLGNVGTMYLTTGRVAMKTWTLWLLAGKGGDGF